MAGRYSCEHEKPKDAPLSRREREVLHAIALTGNLKQTADWLCITQSTLKKHLASARRKLGVDNNIQLIVKAIRNRLLNVEALSAFEDEAMVPK